MKSLMQTDLYLRSADNFKIPQKLDAMLKGNAGRRLSYEEMTPIINHALRTFKDAAFLKAIEDFKNGNIIMAYCGDDMTKALPPFLPFVKFAMNGNKKILLDMSYMVTVRDTECTVKQLESFYALMLTAEFSLNIFDPKCILPADVITSMAEMWAKTFCKVLNRLISLNINPERYEAFMYFSEQFFCRYILETPAITADSVANSLLKNGKSSLINKIEAEVSTKQLPIYESLDKFCSVMFNAEVSGVHSGLRGSSSEINYVTYLSAFMNEYDKSSLYALAAFPYFFLVYVRVNVGSRDINYRSLQPIMMNSRLFAKMLKEITRSL